MVGRVHTHRGDLLVIFSRDGEPDDVRLAPNGDRAAAIAIMVIAGRGTLQPGDRLLVRGDEGAADAE
jgi:hypothetical protein